MLVLAGDIGGTRVRFGVFEATSEGPLVRARHELRSADHRQFESALQAGLNHLEVSQTRLAAVVLGVAGPVRGGRCRLTNLDWALDPHTISSACGGAPVALHNDLSCAAMGTVGVASARLVPLCPGVRRSTGVAQVVSVGTGLGLATLVPRPGHALPTVVCAEAGHQGFAPEGPHQRALLDFLAGHQPRVTWEHVLSGIGLVNLYRFLAAEQPGEHQPDILAAADPAAEIQTRATTSNLCAQACNLLVELLGSFVGNCALTALPSGGVVVTGGVAHHLADHLATPRFAASMVAKAPMGELLAEIPVSLLVDPDVGLLGAARLACELANPGSAR